MQARHHDAPAASPLPTLAQFELGQVVATPAALDCLDAYKVSPLTLLSRHVSKDFGDIDQEDWQANLSALQYSNRIVSAYTIAPDAVIWVITEADRSVTTLLLPEEY